MGYTTYILGAGASANAIPTYMRTSSNSKMEINDKRLENAKEFASKTAAAFAFWLIFKNYEK